LPRGDSLCSPTPKNPRTKRTSQGPKRRPTGRARCRSLSVGTRESAQREWSTSPIFSGQAAWTPVEPERLSPRPSREALHLRGVALTGGAHHEEAVGPGLLIEARAQPHTGPKLGSGGDLE